MKDSEQAQKVEKQECDSEEHKKNATTKTTKVRMDIDQCVCSKHTHLNASSFSRLPLRAKEFEIELRRIERGEKGSDQKIAGLARQR